jgi:hypothetical protein
MIMAIFTISRAQYDGFFGGGYFGFVRLYYIKRFHLGNMITTFSLFDYVNSNDQFRPWWISRALQTFPE